MWVFCGWWSLYRKCEVCFLMWEIHIWPLSLSKLAWIPCQNLVGPSWPFCIHRPPRDSFYCTTLVSITPLAPRHPSSLHDRDHSDEALNPREKITMPSVIFNKCMISKACGNVLPHHARLGFAIGMGCRMWHLRFGTWKLWVWTRASRFGSSGFG